MCSGLNEEQEEMSFSEPAGVFRDFSHHLQMSSSVLYVYSQPAFIEKVSSVFMVS